MTYTDVIILIPSHSLEDFPTEQSESPAAGLLNAFAVAWHPRFLATMPQLPRWHRADDPPTPQAGQLYIIPEVCDGWLPHGWEETARAAEAVVIDHVSDRQEMAQLALAPLDPQDVDADLVADFYALGTCWLQVELLTRHMRNFGNIDEIRLQNRAIAAAKAVVAGDRETAVAHLRSSFEVLLEARERFYPVDCYLIDLCLLIPDVADDHLLRMLTGSIPSNLMITGNDLLQIAEKRPDIIEALRAGVAEGRVCIVGGEQGEIAVPMLPLNSWLHEFRMGRQTIERLTGAVPRVWGRRRFGLNPSLPQLLTKFGYVGALHVGLDDGIYPDAELSRFRWKGCDESVVEAFSRIPLAADTASSYLRFPVRMAESMDHDHVAAICLARWPEVKLPWMEDLHRTQQYAPVLGKFVTFEQLFTVNGTPGRISQHPASGYFTPFLLQHVGRREADPISRYADHALRRLQFDAANWCRSLAAALTSRDLRPEEVDAAETLLESIGPDRSADVDTQPIVEQLADTETGWTRQLAQVILGNAKSPGTGLLLLNPYRFGRRVTLAWPEQAALPAVAGCVKAVDGGVENLPADVTIDVPGCGFVWLSTAGPRVAPSPPAKGAASRKLPSVEPGILRNERFEVTFNEDTGGIAQVRNLNKRENRFSQLISYRFPRERILPGDDDTPASKSHYAETRCLSLQPLRETGAVLEMESTGEVIDQLNGNCLARFRQITRLYRHRPIVELDIELSDVQVPDNDPWNHYLCSRLAWDSSSATLTRSLLDGAQPLGGERIESTHYIEVADEQERLTIVPHGLPFHRKSGVRMLDTLLVVAGETRRRFRFTVALDHSYPLEAAWDATSPVSIIPTETAFAQSGTSGWLLHVDAREVQVLSVEPLCTPPELDSGPTPPAGSEGFTLRLLETEGRRRTARIRFWQSPIFARKRDLRGATIGETQLDTDAVVCELGPYELAEVEVRFG